MSQQSSRPPHLLLHNLIVALSYWGSTVRLLLVGLVLLLAVVLHVMSNESSVAQSAYAEQYIYLMGSLALLDIGYVTIARLVPIWAKIADQVVFLVIMAAMSALVVLPFFVVMPPELRLGLKLLFVISIFVIAIRTVTGLLMRPSSTSRG